jgi:hypothetical protein
MNAKCAICYICNIPDQNFYHYSVLNYSCRKCSLKERIKFCRKSICKLKSKINSAKMELKLIGNK